MHNSLDRDPTPPEEPSAAPAASAAAALMPASDDATGWCLVDPQGAVLCANETWLRSTGLTLQQVLGRDIVDLFPESRDMAAAMHARARAGHRLRVPRHLQGVGGRPAWWEGAIEPMPMPGGVGVLITAREVQPHAPSGASAQRPAQPAAPVQPALSEHEALQHANELLVQSVALVQAIAQTSPDVIFAKDLDGRMRYANPAALWLIGKPADQVLGRTDLEFLDDATAGQQVMDNDCRVMASGQPQQLEEHVPLPDGTPRVWLSLKTPYRDTQGRVAGLLGISRDITDRKRLEEERSRALEQLQRSEERLRMALASVNAGMYDWDMVNDHLLWDERTRDVMGVGPDVRPSLELFLQLLHPEDRPEVETQIRRAMQDPLAGADWQMRYRVKTPAGSWRWVHAPGRVHFERREGRDVPVRFSGLVFDVTEQVQSGQRLQASEEARGQVEERLVMAMESSSLGWWDMDARTQEIFWSQSARRMFDMDQDDVALQAPLSRLHPEDRPRVEAAIAQAQDPCGGGDYQASYRVVWRDGSEHWIDAVGRVHFDEGPPRQAQRFSGVLWDVTAQHALLQSLQDSDRHKNVFLATLAHELRNPLAPLRNAAQLLAAPTLRTDQLRWVQRLIERQVAHMARLLDDLLDLARITQGKLQLKKERVALASIVEPAVETARPLIEHKHHELQVSFGDEATAGLVLEVDPVRLAQVVSNLLTNAAKYTDTGGHIELALRREGATLVVSVRDDGIGLPREARSHIFEMFGQLDTGATRAQGGLGIGLALVRGIVELHGGRVSVDSDGPGRGSRFTVVLPLENVVAAPCIEEDITPLHTGLKVLVADDNEDAAQTLALLLGLAGCDTHVVASGRAALDVASQWRPDVAVLDIGMPELDGHAVARALRQQPGGAGMLLVALTGWGQEDDRQRSAAAGFDHHLTKPVDNRHLLALIAAAARH